MHSTSAQALAASYRVRTFYHSACFVCMETYNIKRCSKCKTVPYCSVAHQKDDWPFHKELCAVIAKTAQGGSCKLEAGCSYSQYNDYRLALGILWKLELGRNLRPCEQFMWMFPRICEVCYSTEKVKSCERCWSVAYCSDEHRYADYMYHMRFCLPLKLCFEAEQYLTREPCLPTYTVQPKISSKYERLTNICQFVRCPTEEGTHSKLICLFKQSSLSCITTIIYSLEVVEFIKNRKSSKEDIVIHIVGASNYEANINWGLSSEFLFHWVENLRSVKYILVGPEVEGNLGPITTSAGLCENCCDTSRHFVLEYHKKLYHDIVDTLSIPNLVVAFNSGFHEVTLEKDTWRLTMPELLRSEGCTLTLTAYTKQEMEEDIERLMLCSENCGEKIVVNMRNPFRNKKPCRNWLVASNCTPIFYNDDNITIIKRVTED